MVVGGSGLIGTKLVAILRRDGRDVVAASPSLGVDTFTGQGLADAVAGAAVVVDVSNPRSITDEAVLGYFDTAGRNLLAAELNAGVGHHVVLSIVGADRLESAYFRAKKGQEDLVKASMLPYTIVRSTQFFEFIDRIAQSATEGQTIRLSPALVRPVAAQDVATTLAIKGLGEPLNGTVELAGPESMPLHEWAERYLSARGDTRTVVADDHAEYFGARLSDRSLVPGGNPLVGPTPFEDWLNR